MSLCVIPARGGSKRIPRKNIREFCGKPMIAWSIEAALKSGCFEHVVVSTDDAEITDVARAAGAEVPFLRPTELSGDFVGTIPVIRHAIEVAREAGWPAKTVCCVYATAPFLTPTDIAMGGEILAREACDFVFTVTKYSFPIQRALRLTAQNRVEMFNPELFPVRSQDLEEAWHDAGQMYWGTSEAWLSADTIFGPGAAPLILPSHRVQDIDTAEDWTRAEMMFHAQGRA